MTEIVRRRRRPAGSYGERVFAVTISMTEEEIDRLHRLSERLEIPPSRMCLEFALRSMDQWENQR